MELEEEQKSLLFLSINELPDEDRLKKTIILTREKERLQKENYLSFISSGMLKNMKRTFKKSGMNEDDVEKEIVYYCESQRISKLTEIEKYLRDL